MAARRSVGIARRLICIQSADNVYLLVGKCEVKDFKIAFDKRLLAC